MLSYKTTTKINGTWLSCTTCYYICLCLTNSISFAATAFWLFVKVWAKRQGLGLTTFPFVENISRLLTDFKSTPQKNQLISELCEPGVKSATLDFLSILLQSEYLLKE